MAIHLGLRFPGSSSGVPGPSAGRVSGTCFALHRTGFGEPPCHHGAGGLLPHRFTLTGACAPAVSSLFHFPSAFAAWGFPSVLPCGVRTFLGRSKPPAATRPAPPVYGAARSHKDSRSDRFSMQSTRHDERSTPMIRLPSPATAIALVALFIASTGTAFAGIVITGANVKNNSLSGLDVRNGSLTTLDVKNHSLLPVDFKKLPSGVSRSGRACRATGACRPGRRARPEGRSRHQRLGADIHDRRPVRQLLAEDRRSLMPARQEAPRRGRTATPPASSAAADRDPGVVRGRRRHLARRRRRDKPDRSQLGAGRHDHLRDGRLGRGATYRAAKGQPPALRRAGATRLRCA